MATAHTVGTEVRYCHEGEDRRAQVVSVHPETGEVTGLAVYDRDGAILCGVADPTLATAKEHRITDGHFWAP